MNTTLAGQLGYRCLLSMRNAWCGVRACEGAGMRVSHGQCVRVENPVIVFPLHHVYVLLIAGDSLT